MRRMWRAVLVVGLTSVAPAASAQEATEGVSIHGFGSSSYGKTDGNAYIVGSSEGSFRNAEMALAVSAAPTEKLHVSTQLFVKQGESGFEPELDYAFAEWTFSEAIRLRAGRVKLPFGIYTEIFNVGTVRPFVTLPQGVYGPSGMVAAGYNGIGLTGRWHHGKGWAFQYDVYGGGINVETNEAAGAELETESIRDMVGGRIKVETPVPGLAFGASGYTGREEEARHSAYGVHGQYEAGPWALRSELVRQTEGDEVRANAFYLEVARRFGPHWQAAVRYDWSDTKAPGVTLARSLGRHQDVGVGLNYWFYSGFVLKLSYHRVEGNRFARPEGDLAEVIKSGLDARTDLVVVGAQFSF